MTLTQRSRRRKGTLRWGLQQLWNHLRLRGEDRTLQRRLGRPQDGEKLSPWTKGMPTPWEGTSEGGEWRGPHPDRPAKSEVCWLLDNVSRMGQRRADTYRLASVLLVQELEPHLNHRTQKTIGYFSIPPKMVNNTAKSEINSSYTGTEKPL